MEFSPTEPISHESARRVADFVASTRRERLPDEVQRKARMTVLDNLSSTLAGSVTPVSRIATEHAAEKLAGDEATILMHGRRASAAGAAFASAWSAIALDLDDGVLPQSCVDELTDLVRHFDYVGEVTRLIECLANCAGNDLRQGEK